MLIHGFLVDALCSQALADHIMRLAVDRHSLHGVPIGLGWDVLVLTAAHILIRWKQSRIALLPDA